MIHCAPPSMRRFKGKGLPALVALLLPIGLGAGGCAASGGDGLAELPSLAEVRPTVTRPTESRSRSAARGPRMETSLEQLELPLDVPLDEAWEHVDETIISEQLRAYWHANGVRVGVIGPGAFEAFAASLPEALAVRRHRITSRGEPVALNEGPHLNDPLTIHAPLLREQNGRQSGRYQAQGGRLRLLARMSSSQFGQIEVELIPQHHQRRYSVKPRDPRDVQLDGEIFEDLAFVRPLSRNQLLVIGLHHPWPKPEDEAPTVDDPDDPDDPDGGEGGAGANKGEGEAARSAETDSGLRSDPLPDAGQAQPGLESEADAEAESAGKSVQPLTPHTPGHRRRAWREQFGEPPELPHHFGRSILTRPHPDQPAQVLILLSARPFETRRAGRNAD